MYYINLHQETCERDIFNVHIVKEILPCTVGWFCRFHIVNNYKCVREVIHWAYELKHAHEHVFDGKIHIHCG